MSRMHFRRAKSRSVWRIGPINCGYSLDCEWLLPEGGARPYRVPLHRADAPRHLARTLLRLPPGRFRSSPCRTRVPPPSRMRDSRAWLCPLLARIHEVSPLVCARCGGEMRIIAFLTDAGAVCEVLTHLGEPTSSLRLMRARAPPLRELQGATLGEDGPWLGRRLNPNSNAALPGRCWGAYRR
jgi:hypothetical protein